MNKDIFYIIHNLVKIQVHQPVDLRIIEQIDFQIAYFKTNTHLNNADIDIFPWDNFKKTELAENFSTFHSFQGLQGRALMHADKHFAILKENSVFKIYTDKPFLINTFIQLLLIEKNYSMVHAAAVESPDKKGFLIPGAGGVGKTSILGHLVKNKKYKLLGDDIVLVSPPQSCLSFPRSFVLKDYHKSVYPEIFSSMNILKKKNSKIPVIMEFVRKNMPLKDMSKQILIHLGLFTKVSQSWPFPDSQFSVPISKIFGNEVIVDKCVIEKIIFLERYEGAELYGRKADPLSISNRMFSIINHEWISETELLETMGAFEIIDFYRYMQLTNEIIKKVVESSPCNILEIPTNTSPEVLADHFESKCLIETK